MILEAKYIGPFARVTVPGFHHRVATKGQVVKLRITEGRPLGGCWEITKGKKEYEAGLKKVADEAKAKAKAKAKVRADAKEAELKQRDGIIESADKNTKPDKKG